MQLISKKQTTGTLSSYLTMTAVDSVDSNISYIGTADIGSATSSAVWKITEIDETTGIKVTRADGNDSFDNIWDNRESLSYS